MKILAYRKADVKEKDEINFERCVISLIIHPMLYNLSKLFMKCVNEGRIKIKGYKK